jgi:hypothetical protein
MQSGTIRCNTQTKRSNRYRKLLLVPTTQNEDDDHFYTPLGWDQSPICTRCALSVIPFAGDKGAVHIKHNLIQGITILYMSTTIICGTSQDPDADDRSILYTTPAQAQVAMVMTSVGYLIKLLSCPQLLQTHFSNSFRSQSPSFFNRKHASKSRH